MFAKLADSLRLSQLAYSTTNKDGVETASLNLSWGNN